MIREYSRRRFPDWWSLPPGDDPRLDSLLDLSNALREIIELAMGENDDNLLPTPLELALMLRSTAERIELVTGDFGHGPADTR